jgi:hypothetical protein
VETNPRIDECIGDLALIEGQDGSEIGYEPYILREISRPLHIFLGRAPPGAQGLNVDLDSYRRASSWVKTYPLCHKDCTGAQSPHNASGWARRRVYRSGVETLLSL